MQEKKHQENIQTQSIIKQYRTGYKRLAIVSIIDNGYQGIYHVEEPQLSNDAKKLLETLKEYILLNPSINELREENIKMLLLEAGEVLGATDQVEKNLAVLEYYIVRDVLGYGKIDVLIRDNLVEEVSVTGPGQPVRIAHREVTDYRWLDTNIVFETETELRNYVILLAQRSGTSISPAFPLREFTLPEGHRVRAALGYEATRKGSSFTIRKFPKPPTILDLVAWNTLSPLMASYLWILVEAQQFIVIVGPQASGKTTLMQALLQLVPYDSKIVTIEETPELNLDHPGWQPYITREPLLLSTIAEKTRISFEDLLRIGLRDRGEYFVIAEARGREIFYAFQAAAVGSGSLLTFHAGTFNEFFNRLKILGIDKEFLALLSCVVLIKRVKLNNGWKRRITSIYELYTDTSGRIRITEVFKWDRKEDSFKPSEPKLTKRLRYIAEQLGWSEHEVLEELEYRAKIIERLVMQQRTTLEDLFKEHSASDASS
ncbi:MAG: hypothetical protein DRO13_05610 [Thermoprotei archaeon]|nr:MAG: hypothetical protein DRO13_05610 [Thermoprotei archaeon]